jgi:hypothetical protein
MREHLLIVHHDGRTTFLEKAEVHAQSTFGGPLELPVEGLPLPRSLHHIAWLSLNQIKCSAPPRHIWSLPLVHPMRYSGGTLTYTFSRQGIQVLELSPAEASDSWPYAGFPELLPFYPVEVSAEISEDWATFAERAPNLPRLQPAELVVLLPPPQGLGFTLWGRAGDDEGVTIVFECNLADQKVLTYNVCS